MEICIVNDPTKPVLPNIVTAYLRGLVDQGIFRFNQIYVFGLFPDVRIEIHNSFGANIEDASSRVINDVNLISALQAWTPTVTTVLPDPNPNP